MVNRTHKNIKPQKANREGSAKGKEAKEGPGKINELILETKADLKEGPGNI